MLTVHNKIYIQKKNCYGKIQIIRRLAIGGRRRGRGGERKVSKEDFQGRFQG